MREREEREREREGERERWYGYGRKYIRDRGEKMSIFVYILECDQSRLAIPVKKVYLRHAIHYNYINTLFNAHTVSFLFWCLYTYKNMFL